MTQEPTPARATQVAAAAASHLFGRRPELMDALADDAAVQRLTANQLVDLDPVADWVVRRGRLRLAEFLADGREMAHGVLESGSCFVTRGDRPADGDDEPGLAGAPLARDRVTLMALGETELWRLAPGALGRHHVR